MATSTVKNNLNNNQPWGLFGTNYNSANTLTCPNGYFLKSLSGNAGADVNAINGMVCQNIVTGATQTVNNASLGAGSGGNNVTISCNGNDSIRGMRVNTSATNNSGGEVNGLQGLCAANGYASGCWGGSNCNGGNNYMCPAGQSIYKMYGSASNYKSHGYLNQFWWDCKDFDSEWNLAQNNISRGRCLVGDDGSAACGDIKAILQGQSSASQDIHDYCKQGSNIVTSSNCAKHYNSDVNNADYDDIMMASDGFCQQGSNFNTDTCKELCTWDTGNPQPNGIKGKCNTLYTTQCQKTENKQLPICSSLQPWETYPGAAAIDLIPSAAQDPLCYFADVRSTGYHRDQINNLGCPKCAQSQSISIKDAPSTVVQGISQSCKVEMAAASGASSAAASSVNMSSVPATNTSSSSAKSTSPAPAAKSTSTTTIVVIVLVAVVLLLCSSSSGGLLAFAK